MAEASPSKRADLREEGLRADDGDAGLRRDARSRKNTQESEDGEEQKGLKHREHKEHKERHQRGKSSSRSKETGNNEVEGLGLRDSEKGEKEGRKEKGGKEDPDDDKARRERKKEKHRERERRKGDGKEETRQDKKAGKETMPDVYADEVEATGGKEAQKDRRGRRDDGGKGARKRDAGHEDERAGKDERVDRVKVKEQDSRGEGGKGSRADEKDREGKKVRHGEEAERDHREKDHKKRARDDVAAKDIHGDDKEQRRRSHRDPTDEDNSRKKSKQEVEGEGDKSREREKGKEKHKEEGRKQGERKDKENKKKDETKDQRDGNKGNRPKHAEDVPEEGEIGAEQLPLPPPPPPSRHAVEEGTPEKASTHKGDRRETAPPRAQAKDELHVKNLSSREEMKAPAVASVPASDSPSASGNKLAERVLKVREQRLKQPKPPRKQEQDEDDISGWVVKSRVLEQKKKEEAREKALKMARMLEEQDEGEQDEDEEKYSSKDLAGLKVRHGVEKVLMEGAAVVLTLKDTSILAGEDLNDEEDELENVEIAEQRKRETAYLAAKKPNKMDDRFAEEMGAEKRMLAQYDDVDHGNQEAFTLDGKGSLGEEAKAKILHVSQKLKATAAASAKAPVDDVGRPRAGLVLAKPQGDFFTAEEMAAFKKPKVKKEKKLRRKKGGGKLDLDELEREAKAAGLGGAGDMGTKMGAGADLVRRRREEREQEEQGRQSRYAAALMKEKEASKVLRDGLTKQEDEGGSERMDVDDYGDRDGWGEADEDVVIGDEDEDGDLQRSLQRARQAALKNQQQAKVKGEDTEMEDAEDHSFAGVGNEGEAAVLARMGRVKGESTEADGVEAEEGGASGLVFTDTGEFCRSLQLEEKGPRRSGAKDAPGLQSVASTAGSASIAAPPIKDPQDGEEEEGGKKKRAAASGGWKEVPAAGDATAMDEDEEGEEEETVEEPLPEAQVGKGLAGALALLKDRGALKNEVEWGGRTMDKKKSKLLGVYDEDDLPGSGGGAAKGDGKWPREVSIDRRDEFGRIMTPKEAFRKMSHKFHGKGPGKMKQEKYMTKYMEDLKRKSMVAGDTPLHSVEKLREVQEQMSSPYIVISGHIKPGQISDPRSGFATSEREPAAAPSMSATLGNLTPMLGDKKVEHFLGMAKGAVNGGGGSMGPPPPRAQK